MSQKIPISFSSFYFSTIYVSMYKCICSYTCVWVCIGYSEEIFTSFWRHNTKRDEISLKDYTHTHTQWIPIKQSTFLEFYLFMVSCFSVLATKPNLQESCNYSHTTPFFLQMWTCLFFLHNTIRCNSIQNS